MLWMITTFLGLLCSSAAAKNTYTAYMPKFIRPGFEVGYTISVFNTANPVEVTSVFYSSSNELSLRKIETVENGSSKKIVLGKVPIGYSGSTRFLMNVTGVDAVSRKQIFQNHTDAFTFATKAFSVLIQTDKAIYKPGHTIKFRALCLKPDLRPLNELVTYQVQDPNDNIVLLEQNVSLSQGVAGGEFPLNKDSIEGDWKIIYTVQGYKEILPVSVKLYKLPKFEVKLDVPTYIHPKLDGFTLKLSATYTYGKPVDGAAQIIISPRFHYRYYDIASPDSVRESIARANKDFNGNWEVFISMEDVKSKLNWGMDYEMEFVIIGIVNEEITGISRNDTQHLKAEPTNIKVDTIFKLETIKPGLTYTAYIEVSEFDGKRLMDEDRLNNNLVVDMTYEYPRGHRFPEDTTAPSEYAYRSRQESRLYTIPQNGIVEMSIEAKSDDFTQITFRPYTNNTAQNARYSNQFVARRAQSPSSSYLQILTNDANVSPGNTASITVKTTSAINLFQILILGRGEILRNVTYLAPGGTKSTSHEYSFETTHVMVPGVQVLASYVGQDGEIIADYVHISVSLSLEDEVTINPSASSVDAGTDVSIRIETKAPGSYVGVRAIDQSVLLLKSGNDISTDRVVQDLDRYSVSDDYSNNNEFSSWWWFPRPSGAKDATEVFKKAGIICLTDAFLYSGPFTGDWFFPEIVEDQIMFDAAGTVEKTNTVNQQPPSTSQASVTPRSYFPETWLWKNEITRSDGSTVINTTAPDTITSWVLSAFSVSDQYGLGIAETNKITVFRNFFVSLNLPLKVIRGEIIIIQAVVFNYFQQNVDVQLTLQDSEKFEFILTGDDAEAAGQVRNFQIQAGGAYSIKFPIRMKALGEVPVTVSARSDRAGDAITRNVFVRPEGRQECYSTSALINRNSSAEERTTEDLEIRFPDGIVEGSGKATLYVYGDILGSTMNNLGRLLKTPGGCGEQNMLRFAPDVFVTIYLAQAGILDAETKDKAYGHIRDGYSIELKYKHDDGSYSAFGGSDNSGSTWLTAFVIKCFIYARNIQAEFIEARIVDQGLNFLVGTQADDGSFKENGHVSHRSMQGGVNSAITMTAYVLITLRETEYPSKNAQVLKASDKARTYLENFLESISEDTYALAMVTYALEVSGSTKADLALEKLTARATNSGGLVYWHRETPTASSYNERWRPPYYQASTNDIEMTSYALLTYAKRGDVGATSPIVKWLTSKQNQFGGYSSTQDTVMAVQALSHVAALFINRRQDLNLSFSHSAMESFSFTYNIDSTNSIVFNTVPVDPINGMLQVSAEGEGVGVAQLSVCYNIGDDPFKNEPFNCELELNSDNLDSAELNFCCRQKDGINEPSGMFLFEIGLPNGFTVDLEMEKSRNDKAKLVELGDESFNVYYDELKSDEKICAHMSAVRYADVAGIKPSPIVAQEYYEPSNRVSRMYGFSRLSDAGVCSVCGSDCPGCPGKPDNSSPTSPRFHLVQLVVTALLAALLLRN